MNFPALLIGRMIRNAQRVEQWLYLSLDDGREVYVAGGRVRLDLECPRCGEFRIVEVVETAGKTEGVCGVCAHAWKIPAAEKGGGT